MNNSEIGLTVEISKDLRKRLDFVSKNISESQFFVDLADIHEICRNYIECIEKVLSSKTDNKVELENVFTEIHLNLFEHLQYHLESLEKLMPEFLEELDNLDE